MARRHFLAVSDAQPVLAGVRVFYDKNNNNNKIRNDDNDLVLRHARTGDDKSKGAADRDICDAQSYACLRRDYDIVALGGPPIASLDHATALAYLDSISDRDAAALLGAAALKGASDLPDASTLRSPFGVPQRDDNGSLSVRCFVAGLRTNVSECIFVSNGLLYSIDGFGEWERMCASASSPLTDPCTGDLLGQDMPRLAWQDWMGSVPFTLIVPAVREAFRRWASLPASSLPKTGPPAWSSYHMDDLVRKWVADALEVPLFDAAQIISIKGSTLSGCATEPAAASALVDSTLAVRPPLTGWDHTRLAHIEFRHPSWDPRGPWRFGPPPSDLVPDDPTMADYERDTVAAPSAYYASHGVVKVALSRPTFVGAHLRNVFFIGQDLSNASFVGAVLDRCAFIGCTLDDWMLLDASLAICGIHDCRIGGRPVTDMADAAGNRGATIWPQ
nr:F-box domain protein [Pandoravirus massiliensis]